MAGGVGELDRGPGDTFTLPPPEGSHPAPLDWADRSAGWGWGPFERAWALLATKRKSIPKTLGEGPQHERELRK